MAHSPGLKQKYPCGCEARAGMESISLIQCPLHEGAEGLLKSLEAVLPYLESFENNDDPSADAVVNCVRAAISKARGVK